MVQKHLQKKHFFLFAVSFYSSLQLAPLSYVFKFCSLAHSVHLSLISSISINRFSILSFIRLVVCYVCLFYASVTFFGLVYDYNFKFIWISHKVKLRTQELNLSFILLFIHLLLCKNYYYSFIRMCIKNNQNENKT